MDILLTEEFLFNIKNEFGVYKNPKSIKRMVSKARAISDKNGDLFVLDNVRNVIHFHFYRILKLKNVIGDYGTSITHMSPEKVLYWQRNGASNIFKLSESYDREIVEKLQNMKLPNLDKLKKKNPQYTFLLERIW